EMEPIEGGSLKFRWPDAEHDFGYPLEISSSAYRGDEMRALLGDLEFKNPNTLEDKMCRNTARFRQKQSFLACWERSAAFSIPINKVQQIWDNRAGNNAAYSVDSLAALFAAGQRIQSEDYKGMVPKGCHEEAELKTSQEAPSQPLVSVVIPCYNQASYLPEAVASVVAQTFSDWEIIIVNDGSPDKTSDVARDLIKKHAGKLIRLVEKPNGGLSEARNAGFKGASGEYLLPLDADDLIAPTFLAKATAVLDERPKVGFVYSHIQHFGLCHDLYPLPEFDADTLVYRDNIGCVCSLMRRTVWEQVEGYNINMKEGYEDWDFWVGCVQAGWKGWRIPEPLFLYRKRENSMLTTTVNKRQRLIAQVVLNHRALYSPERIRRAEMELQANGNAPKPVKVLFASTHFWPSIGGVETIIENLGVWLIRRGFEVDVATMPHKERDFPMYRGMRILNLNPDKIKGKWPGLHPQLGKFATSGEYAACIPIADPQNCILWSLEGEDVHSSTRVIAQPIINAEGYANWKNNLKFRQRLVGLLSRFHSIVALSKAGTEVKFLREAAIPFVYLPNATDAEGAKPEAFREKYKIPEGRPLLLHVANLVPVKNHFGLMSALKLLPGDWQLVMIGHPGGNEEYNYQVRQSAASDPRFLLIPGLPHDEIASAMAAADVVLLTSHGEVSPVCILEAMNQGKPWVATPACGAVSDNAGGLVVQLSQFPETLQKLLAHPALAKRLGRLGWEHWKACFNWDHVGECWEELILTGKTSGSFAMPDATRKAMAEFKAEWDALPNPTPKDRPTVSVIVPTYNRPDRLEETLRSVLAQTFQDFEIIVVNDGGIDVSQIIARLNRPSQIIHHVHPVNRGLSAARNTALRLAQGRYISFLDDDDIFLPDHLETLVTFLETTGHPAAFTDALCAVEQKQPDGKYQIVRRYIAYPDDWDKNGMLRQNSVHVISVLHERGLGLLTGEFDEQLTTHEDWDYWIRLSRLFTPMHIRKTTCEFRSRDDGTSMTSSRRADFLRTTRVIYQKHATYAAGKRSTLRRQKRVLQKLEQRLNPSYSSSLGARLSALGRKIFRRQK
ncbi:MAG TPA: glycosyltransferase, partial [Verrucomicrobiae bacterium]